MSTMLVQSGNLILRELRALVRQPFWIAITLVQPMIWLLLFGQLFKRVVEIPGFSGDSYIAFMTPGIVIMTVLFTAGWSGSGFIDDLNRGVMNRLLVSPARRAAVLSGKLGYLVVSLVIQSLIVILVGIAAGARYEGGVLGVLVTLVSATLLAIAFGSLSNALALLVRKMETLIGVSNFLVLPLSFLSSAIMAKEVAPAWMQTAMTYNPVNWAVTASREALSANPDWASVLLHTGLLLALALVMAALAVRAFGSYQRSV